MRRHGLDEGEARRRDAMYFGPDLGLSTLGSAPLNAELYEALQAVLAANDDEVPDGHEWRRHATPEELDG